MVLKIDKKQNNMMEKIKQLREATGAGVMMAKKALEETGGDVEKAIEVVRAKGAAKAAEKSERSMGSGRIYCYSHQTGKAGAMVEIGCETDFVANNEEFAGLCKEVAMQVVSMNPESVEALLEQDYIRDGSRKIGDLVKDMVGKTGENIQIIRFVRYILGE